MPPTALLLRLGGAATAAALTRLGDARDHHRSRCQSPSPELKQKAAASQKQAICIGAGAAGLACAKELLERGFNVTVLEAREGIGGVWRFDGTGQHPGVRRDQIATSSKYYLGFSDFPFPDHAPEFVGHEAYLAYLESYAERFGVAPLIRFSTSVEEVRQTGDGGWAVNVKSKRGKELLHCDIVAVCSGLHRRPTAAAAAALAPGEFSGTIMHTAELKDAWTTVKGKRTVVVGGGETGAETAHIAATAGVQPAFLSLRRGITTIGPYLPLPLSGRMPDSRTPPVDLNERRIVSMLPEAVKSFIFTQSGFFELRDENPGKHSLARLCLNLAGLGFTLVESLVFVVGGAASEVVQTVSRWSPNALPYRASTDGAELSNQMRDSVARIGLDSPRPLGRDLSQLEAYNQRAASFRLRGYSSAHYREVRCLLEEHSGAAHTGNFLTKSDDFIYDLMSGSLQLRPGITSFQGREIIFSDGSAVEADLVLCCTGYAPHVPFVKAALHKGNWPAFRCRGRIGPGQLYKRVFAPRCGSSLGFIGFARPQIGAMPPIAELQARWFAAVQAGEVVLPDTAAMEDIVEREAHAYESKVFAHRLRASVDFAKYTQELATLAGCYPQVGLAAFLQSNLLWRAFWFGPVLPQAYRIADEGERGVAARSYLERVYVTFFTRN